MSVKNPALPLGVRQYPQLVDRLTSSISPAPVCESAGASTCNAVAGEVS